MANLSSSAHVFGGGSSLQLFRHRRHPRRRAPVVVPDPVPARSAGCRTRSRTRSSRRARASSPRSSPRSCSSARSCCTSSGTRFAARREGIGVGGIDLFFFGGFMRAMRDSETPGEEFRVAAAGPAVTLLLTLVFGARRLRAARRRARATPRRSDSPPARCSRSSSPSPRSPTPRCSCSTWSPRSRSTAAGSRARSPGSSAATATRRPRFAAYLGQGFAALMMGYGVYRRALGRRRPGRRAVVDRARLDARRRGARGGRPEQLRRPPGGRHRRRHHGLRARDDPGRRCRSSAPTTSSSCATRAGRGSRSSRTTGTSPASPTAPRSSTPRSRRTPTQPVRDVVADSEQVRTDTPLESLIGNEPLRTLGALMAVDAEGRLRGVVTLDQVSRALQARLASAAVAPKAIVRACPHTTC